MIEPPSPKLIKTLSEFALCRPGDLRRCRPLVRRLAHDLPAFDSVWIDALVRIRRLTYFQARELESGRHNRLSIGPCILLDRLGRSNHAETFLARRQRGRERCVLKLIDVPIEDRPSRLAALEELSSSLRGVPHPSFVAPNACLEHDGRIVTISRYVPGLHLGELLVRRGRFAASNVTAIARQLVDALATLEERGQVHGDINLWNVRLTSAGVAVLVDTGVNRAVRPELTIHARRPPERYEGIAPELIGTGNHPSPSSDLYALGCLLWQLLAGRPPFPTGDPLAKLAAHQTKSICDVRQWAPDTPASLAEAVASLTARDAADRPASIRDVRQTLGAPGRGARRRLSRFRAAFEAAAPRSPGIEAAGTARRWPAALLLLLACSIAAVALFDRGARSDPLSVPGRVSAYVRQATGDWFDAKSKPDGPPADQTAESDETVAQTEAGSRPLPAADANGVILLDSDGPYAWRPLQSAGAIVVRGRAGLRPSIVVNRRPCRVAAGHLTLENVHFVVQPSRLQVAGGTPAPQGAGGKPASERERQDEGEISLPALLLVESRKLTITGCSFETHATLPADDEAQPAAVRPVAVAWKRLEGADEAGDGVAGAGVFTKPRAAHSIVVRDTIFLGRTAALYLSDAPTSVECVNCAKVGDGAMLTLADFVPADALLSLDLRQLTLRGAACLLRWRPKDERGARGYVAIQAADCVFDLAGSEAALLQFVGDGPIEAATARIEVTGAESLARPGLVVATQVTSAGTSVALHDPAVVELEGITTGPFTFAGPVSAMPGDAAVETFNMPRRSPDPPGIDASRLATTASLRTASQSAN